MVFRKSDKPKQLSKKIHYKILAKIYNEIGYINGNMDSISSRTLQNNKKIKSIAENNKIITKYPQKQRKFTPFYVFMREFYDDIEFTKNLRLKNYYSVPKNLDDKNFEAEEQGNVDSFYSLKQGLKQYMFFLWDKEIDENLKSCFLKIAEDERRIYTLCEKMREDQKHK